MLNFLSSYPVLSPSHFSWHSLCSVPSFCYIPFLLHAHTVPKDVLTLEGEVVYNVHS